MFLKNIKGVAPDWNCRLFEHRYHTEWLKILNIKVLSGKVVNHHELEAYTDVSEVFATL